MGGILLLETPVNADGHRRSTAGKTRQKGKHLTDPDGKSILPARLADSLGRRRKALQKQQDGCDQEHGRYKIEAGKSLLDGRTEPVSYTHLRAHETRHDLVCRLLLEKKKKKTKTKKKT